jgi:Family of unknown function (DUF5336)
MSNTIGRSTNAGSGARLTQSLWAVVAVAGATTFAVSLAAPALLGYPVRLSVLAATVAAVGLLPSQTTRGWIVVGFAVTGCLDALAVWVKTDQAHWAITVVLVLNSVQSVAAVGALLRESGAPEAVPSEGNSDYSAYLRLVEAYQAYATRYQQQFSPSQNAAGQAGAHGKSHAAAHADAAEDAFAALQARYVRHGVDGAAQQSRGSAEPPSAAQLAESGVPGANRVAPEGHPYPGYQHDSGVGGVEQTGL